MSGSFCTQFVSTMNVKTRKAATCDKVTFVDFFSRLYTSLKQLKKHNATYDDQMVRIIHSHSLWQPGAANYECNQKRSDVSLVKCDGYICDIFFTTHLNNSQVKSENVGIPERVEVWNAVN